MSHVFIYLDESGCLGFSSGSSKFLVITILKVNGLETQKGIFQAIRRTIKSKLSSKKKKCNVELKGSKISLNVKKYFIEKMPKTGWSLHAVILNKGRIAPHLKTSVGKKRLYNYLAKFLLSNMNLRDGISRLDLYIDKSKNTEEIKDFNKYIEAHLDLTPNAILNINHVTSHENPAIQAVDLFCWGIAKKHTLNEKSWYDCFKENIIFEKVYLPDKK